MVAEVFTSGILQAILYHNPQQCTQNFTCCKVKANLFFLYIVGKTLLPVHAGKTLLLAQLRQNKAF
jgi:hypothetical protein